MTGRAFDHVGIVVPDIDAARGNFAAALGITFTAIVTMRIVNWELVGQGTFSENLRVCYSVDGPPHYELIQQTAGGVWGPDQAGRVHHIGYGDPDVEARLAELAAAGVNPEVRYRNATDGNRMYAAFTEPASLHGARLEIVYNGRPSFIETYGPEAARRRRESRDRGAFPASGTTTG
jgi:catechol 2,3-dioxygenase-like lactoylglutathione lyase family enzyme